MSEDKQLLCGHVWNILKQLEIGNSLSSKKVGERYVAATCHREEFRAAPVPVQPCKNVDIIDISTTSTPYSLFLTKPAIRNTLDSTWNR